MIYYNEIKGCNIMNELEKLQKQILKCRICKETFGFEPNPIVSGNINAKIVQLGQAPSKKASKTNKFFDDQSGKRLKYEWYQITDKDFYNPDNFYILPMAHCFPGQELNGHDKIPPKICFQKWGAKELELINNEIYIIIGAKAAKAFFPEKDFEELVFNDQTLNNKVAFVLPHPSPLNKKWLKDHPLFMQKRIKKVRKVIKNIIKSNVS